MRDIKDIANLNVHVSTVSRIVRNLGFDIKVVNKKKTLDDELKQRRLEWPWQYAEWDVTDWCNIIYNDEAKFSIGYYDTTERYWIHYSDDPKDPKFREPLIRNAKQSAFV